MENKVEVSDEYKLRFIKNFINTLHDYNPIASDDRPYTGCFNTKYHGNIGQCLVWGPATLTGEKSMPMYIIAYESTKDGRIILCTSSLYAINIIHCPGNSLDCVYETIKEVKKLKDEYDIENNKNGDYK